MDQRPMMPHAPSILQDFRARLRPQRCPASCIDQLLDSQALWCKNRHCWTTQKYHVSEPNKLPLWYTIIQLVLFPQRTLSNYHIITSLMVTFLKSELFKQPQDLNTFSQKRKRRQLRRNTATIILTSSRSKSKVQEAFIKLSLDK